MAESISGGRIVQKPEIVLDPNFFLPPGVTGVRLERADERGAVKPDSKGSGADSATDSEYTYDNPDLDPTTLRPPGWLKVISQVVRQGPGGVQVVDLIIEVEDVPGVTEYPVRVTKP